MAFKNYFKHPIFLVLLSKTTPPWRLKESQNRAYYYEICKSKYSISKYIELIKVALYTKSSPLK